MQSAPRWYLLTILLLSLGITPILGVPLALAQAVPQSFSDLPPSHPAYAAVEYLKGKEILSGYPDGTFKPDKKVNRAEAVKIIVAPLTTAEERKQWTTTVFSDIAPSAWYLPYVEAARKKLSIVDGPPKKSAFLGEQPVKKVELLKMLLLANKIDPNTFSELHLPLSSDVTDPSAWYYPYLRFSLSASMLTITPDGLLSPGQELSRGDTALLLYYFLMYHDGRRTQSLLSNTEMEIINILKSLEQNNITQAEYASARALFAARGAHAKRPDEPIVQAALKTTEGFQLLVQAYRTGLQGKFDEVVTLAGNAWQLATKARDLSPLLSSITDQMQTIAKNMADEARRLKTEKK